MDHSCQYSHRLNAFFILSGQGSCQLETVSEPVPLYSRSGRPSMPPLDFGEERPAGTPAATVLKQPVNDRARHGDPKEPCAAQEILLVQRILSLRVRESFLAPSQAGIFSREHLPW